MLWINLLSLLLKAQVWIFCKVLTFHMSMAKLQQIAHVWKQSCVFADSGKVELYSRAFISCCHYRPGEEELLNERGCLSSMYLSNLIPLNQSQDVKFSPLPSSLQSQKWKDLKLWLVVVGLSWTNMMTWESSSAQGCSKRGGASWLGGSS